MYVLGKKKIRGFMIQARKKDAPGKTIGKFKPDPGHMLQCDHEGAITNVGKAGLIEGSNVIMADFSAIEEGKQGLMKVIFK